MANNMLTDQKFAALWPFFLLKNSSKNYGPATQIDSRNKRVIPRVVIASLIMGGLLLITNHSIVW